MFFLFAQRCSSYKFSYSGSDCNAYDSTYYLASFAYYVGYEIGDIIKNVPNASKRDLCVKF